MKFTDAHTSDTICTPTRYGILTGRYSWRSGLKKGVLRGNSHHLIDPARETVASFLKKQGYATACIGKWHLGMELPKKSKKPANGPASEVFGVSEFAPNAYGFDYSWGVETFNLSPHCYVENGQALGNLEYIDSKDEIAARGIEGNTGWLADDFNQTEVLEKTADKTCGWIREHAQEPFFAYMPLNAPHYPLMPRDEFRGKSGLSLHGDFMMEVDWAVGEVLKTLDELKLSENTLVIFTSDNGIAHKVGNAEMQAKGHFSCGIYRGCKGNIWEGGHRVPFLVRWPVTVKAGVGNNDLICTTDLLATVADLCKVPLAENTGEDSVSFLRALNGLPIPGNDSRGIVHHSDQGTFALRRGKWKLVLDDGGPSPRVNPKDQPIINSDATVMLFDMETDEVESTNVAAQKPETVDAMMRELASIVFNGRSTPGPTQQNEKASKGKWTQVDSLRSYCK
ncbi:sulfatase family protein [Pontiella sulfatireligans]|uniref:Arylsulfatase n=1 Tax=Pontiella sulfatireligans TaxID=2750658 RepID=A0A6C2UFU8_9BACT|nr:arylsulfatase [Pontiella sulfatireligans]SPS74131.1 sulfatase S1_15 [Kiritimatiellales bacterium]VGO18086.1 Arylsulfatase [Pontiella sulfatireligans]